MTCAHPSRRDAGCAACAVAAAFWLGCMGPKRVSMLPPLGGSSPGTAPVQPIEQAVALPERDSAGSLVNDDSGLAQGEVTLAGLLVSLFTGSGAPFIFGVFGVFDEDRLVGRPVQLERRPSARPGGKGRASCPPFLCGPVSRRR
jgi:hypothetical protein